MWEHCLTKKDLELVEILKQKEITKGQARLLGYKITEVFLCKCNEYGVLIYETDEKGVKKKYGILKREEENV